MKHFIITKESLNLFLTDLKRFIAKLEGSERILSDSENPVFNNMNLDINKVYITKDFEILFERIRDTFDYIQKQEIKRGKNEQISSSKTS